LAIRFVFKSKEKPFRFASELFKRKLLAMSWEHTVVHTVATPETLKVRVAPEVVHAKAAYSVKGEDVSRVCVIELAKGHTVKYYAVFDGHGGAECAKFCADRLPDLIASHYGLATGATRAERIGKACKSAFVAIDQQFMRTVAKTDGTTATIVIIDGDEATVANVGDSTAMMYGANGDATTISFDHRVERRTPEEHQRLMLAGAQIGRIRGHHGQPVGPERVYPGGLCVTRSIGDSDSTPGAIAEPDVRTIQLPPGGAMIVLGTDGIWDFIEEAQVKRLVATSRKHASPSGWLGRSVLRTVRRRNDEIDDALVICIEAGDFACAMPRSPFEKMRSMFGMRNRTAPTRNDDNLTASEESDGSNNIKGSS
jgi:serine/threonine protein phosphatase PrpC